ncbi:serine/threonine protein kinase [Streptomyces sp. TRM72054]|uniref:serine/threonine-protein kinase n=1 Tax=Streptomyces sp. TRM72054 TaxID=2870562 RepID=UPI001C8CA635|nr:serine/threonine-protein kinase [Streptomyces sp. TRM72054]MBX9397477.1 serine/threonine protein kinase [Streptomyces sp. TRM72054]
MDRLGPGDPPRIGAYRLLARLGAGGMGHVYLARSDRGRTVAVKLVRKELAAQEEFRARFRQEVRAAREVGGHWTAPVLDADTEAAVPWVATGYVAGPSLQQVVGRDHGALPERSVRILAAGLAHALKDIHAAGIVHRDLKPSNVLVTIDGPRVIDFGIARAMETVTDGGLTRTGALVGSPGFMAPEQVRGDRITPACDVFCLGSVLAYAATGHLPFGGADSGVHALMFRIAQEEPDLDGVPEGIADLVRHCLRKDPAARPTLDDILRRTGAEDTLTGGRSRDPWLPGGLVAQLGRHAVQLLEREDPEGAGGADADRGASPEHASAADEAAPAAAGQQPGAQPLDRMPPAAAAQGAVPPAPPHPAYGSVHQGQGHPQQAQAQGQGSAQSAAPPPPYVPMYGPHNGGAPAGGAYHSGPYAAASHTLGPYGGLGPTRPYGAPPAFPPEEPPRRSGRTTVALLAMALVVALAAGGTVYALMDGTESPQAGPTASAPADSSAPTSPDAPTTPDGPTTSPEPSASATPADGAIPSGYLGTWTATIDNASGQHTRRLTLQQGEVGDTVLSLVADGPVEGGGSYHCVFQAGLAAAPGADGPVRVGPSTVTVGEPATACTPGAATEITLLPDGSLQRVNGTTGEKLTYRRQ